MMTLLLILMTIVLVLWFLGDTPRTSPPSPPPVPCERSDPDASREALETARVLEADALHFLEHLKKQYPNDSRTQLLDARWNKRILPSSPYERTQIKASFNKKSGCLHLALHESRPRAQLLGIMLHELAHCVGVGHDEDFRKTWIQFLNVATRELGWDVALHCQNACTSYNVCGANCSLCTCV